MGFSTRRRMANGQRLWIQFVYGENDEPTSYQLRNDDGAVGEPFADYEAAKDRLAELRVEAATTTPTGKKRNRTVFPSSEIAHLWMHKAVPVGYNSTRNFYFERDTIYSYGSHFPIARHVTNEAGEQAILFTTRDYSVTTSGHKSAVRSAIPSSATVFYAPLSGSWRDTAHDEVLKDYRERIKNQCEKAARARKNRDYLLGSAAELRDEALKYAAFFGIEAQIDEIPTDLDALRKRLAAQAAAEAAETRKRNEQEEAEARVRLAKQIEQFRAGIGSDFYLRQLPAMLRVKDGEVETSWGARFPVSHAKRGLKLIRAVVERGEAWQTNGHTCHLGHYQIDRIDKDGTVHAGCHVVSYEEILRIAPELDNTPDNAISEAA